MKKRSDIFHEYAANIEEFISLSTGDDPEEIKVFVTNLIRSRIKDRKIQVLASPTPGNTKVVTQSLFGFLREHDEDIISASGSVYTPVEKQQSEIGKMITEMLAKRKKFKSLMFEAIARDDKVEANKNKFAQATMKINCNSLPGAFGSEYNVFYDKGNYNTITGLNRSLIAHAYSTVEQCIGANEALFSETEVINHIVSNVRNMPDIDKVKHVMDHYHLEVITKDELLAYYKKQVNQYALADLDTVSKILDGLEYPVISYLYYMGKFPHIFQKNETIFRGYFERLFNTKEVKRDPDTKPEDLKEIDEDLVIALQVIASEELKGYPDLKDVKKNNPELYLWFVDFCKYGNSMIRQLDELMETFIFYPTDYQHIGNRHEMYRNSVPISDTDSVITTMVKWMLWYNKGDMFVNQDSYSITAMGIYFMTKCVEHSLYKYSIGYGARGKYAKIMKMKNEFLYVALVLYALKKTYAGIIAIHEGIKLKKFKVDIKGANLRSSAICKESTDFNKELIVKGILEIFASGKKISGENLINRVVEFERKIYDDIRNLGTQYLESTSIKEEREYAKPLSSDYFYYLAWHEIFADKYGDIRLPSKFPTLKLKEITPLFIECIQDKSIQKKFKDFFQKYGKWPSAIALNPMSDTFPKELLPIANIREAIYLNIRPSYLTLERMNISVGNEKQHQLISDIYGSLKL